MRFVAVLLASVLSWSAFAQEPAPPAPAPDAGAEADAEAAALYRLGLDLAAKGQYAEACGIFDRITREHPGSEYAAKAEDQMALAALAAPGGACGTVPGPAPTTEEPVPWSRREASKGKGDHDGRVELIISQALVGPAFLGFLVPASAGADAPWIFLTGGLVGLGAGIGIPLAITWKHPISEGQAMTVFSGEIVGSWNGLFIAGAFPALWQDDNALQLVSAVITTGFVAGTAAGVGAAVGLKPTAGEASMFRSGLTWGAYFGAMSILFTNGTSGSTDTFLRLGIASDVGAGLGAVAATQWPISRSHMNIVNLSGYAGALGLGLIYGIISLGLQETSAPVWGAVLTTGAVGGITAGALLSRNMDMPKLAWMGNGSPVYLADDHVTFGMPLPTPRVAPDGSFGVNVEIASGRW